MIRWYVLPVEQSGTVRGPKYMDWGDPSPPDFVEHPGIEASWGIMDYSGMMDVCIMVADVSQAQHEQLAVEPDVAGAPEDIDQNISPTALPKVQAVLEALRIPADWVDTTYTYRAILRMVAGLFQFAQRHYGLHNEELITSPAQLDLRWNQIPQDKQLRIIATVDSFGYDYSDVTNQWLVRRILKYLADQWAGGSFDFGLAVL